MTSEETKIPSNEEIINELTKDLEQTLEIDSSAVENSESEIKDNDKHELTEQCLQENQDHILPDETKIENELNSDVKESSDVFEDDDFREQMVEKLTDEEKEERRSESQNLKKEGNDRYNEEAYSDAVKKYTQALLLCPACFTKERSIMYSNRAACHVKLDQQQAAIKDCTQAIDLNPSYTKAILRRAQLYESTDKLDEALADYKRIVELEPKNIEANQACMTLPQRINERNEKLKDEMMGKLKDLGNMILKPFGLSTSNFQLNQDPNSGGYSVNFQNNGNGQKKT